MGQVSSVNRLQNAARTCPQVLRLAKTDRGVIIKFRFGNGLKAPLAFLIYPKFAIELVLLDLCKTYILAALCEHATPARPERTNAFVMIDIFALNPLPTSLVAAHDILCHEILDRCCTFDVRLAQILQLHFLLPLKIIPLITDVC